MSHIPSSAMHHAKEHHDDPDPQPQADAATVAGKAAEAVETVASAVTAPAADAAGAVKSAASAATDQAAEAAGAVKDAAASAGRRAAGLPVVAQVLGGLALASGIIAAITIPLFRDRVVASAPKPKRKGKKRKEA